MPWARQFTDALQRLEPPGSSGSSTPPTNDGRSPSPATSGPAGFNELLPTTIASAGVDRFMHHAHAVVTDDPVS